MFFYSSVYHSINDMQVALLTKLRRNLPVWLLFGLALIATVFLFVGDPYSFHQRSVTEIWNLGHVVYFACLTFLLGQWSRLQAWPWWRQLAFALGAALLLGIIIECLQYGLQRSMDWRDVARDLVGSLLVLAFFPRFLVGMASLWRSMLRLATVLLTLLLLVPLTIALVDETIARIQFPLLADFNTPFELNRWEGNSTRTITQLDPDREGHQMEIGLNTDQYSGVSMEYLPSDWRGYAYVSLRLYQPSPKIPGITVRIHDEQHETGPNKNEYADRFNHHYKLKLGWNNLHIPLAEVKNAPSGRQMNMAQIRDISFFSIELREPGKLYLDKIYLAN